MKDGKIGGLLEVSMTYQVPLCATSSAHLASFSHQGEGSDLEQFIEKFGARGLVAPAIECSRLCMDELARMSNEGRVPITGATVTALPDGRLQVQTRAHGTRGYHNGRIPGLKHFSSPDFVPDFDPNIYDGDSVEHRGLNIGYPADHGETGTVRQIDDFLGVDWGRSVFATSLSPCIMCTRMLEGLYQFHGLRNVVICESKSFVGGGPRLDQLDGVSDASIKPELPKGEAAADKKMQVARLANETGQLAMKTFAHRYPHDWAGDIGAIPPRRGYRDAILAEVRENGGSWLRELAEGEAAVYGPDPYYKDPTAGKFNIRRLSVCKDLRPNLGYGLGDNLCRAAVMRAVGTAGSAVNLQECAVLWKHPPGKATLRCFSGASLGTLELFRPAALIVPSEEAKEMLQDLFKDRNATAEAEGFNGTEIICAAPLEPPSKKARTE